MSDLKHDGVSPHTNVISLDRARQLKQEAEFHLAFPHMYVDFELSVKALQSEMDWLADNEFIPDVLTETFRAADIAVSTAMVALCDYIIAEGKGHGD